MREYLLRPIVGSARLSRFVAAMTRTEFSRPMDLAGFAHELVAAWNAHDLEQILAHCADDVELVSPFVAKLTGGGESAVRGKAALRDYFVRGLKEFPALRFELARVYSGVRSCVLEYHSVNCLRTAEDATDRGLVETVSANGRSLVRVKAAGFALLKEKRPDYYAELKRNI